MALQPFVGPWLHLNFVIFFTQTVGLLGWGISPSQGRYLHTEQHKHRINGHTGIHALCGKIGCNKLAAKYFKFIFMLFASVFIGLLSQLNCALTTHCEYGSSVFSADCELRFGHLTCIMQSNYKPLSQLSDVWPQASILPAPPD
jgi:hypothetical protein